jgi:Protein of unknown function (DUF2934)
MDRFNDHDGKSTTSSAADARHYPEPDTSSILSEPTHSEISARAYSIWLKRGQPADAAEGIWLEAEHELMAAAKSRSLLEKVHERAGSVQP